MSDIDLTRAQEALKHTREGELLRLAARDPMSIPLFAGALVKAERVPKSVAEWTKRALCRQLTHHGPGARGYDAVLLNMFQRYKEVSVGSAHTLSLVGVLESHGFRFEHNETVACLKAVNVYVREACGMFEEFKEEEPAFIGSLSRMSGVNLSAVAASETFFERAFDGIIHQMALALGWDCKRKNKRRPTPITTPTVFLHCARNLTEVAAETNTRHLLSGIARTIRPTTSIPSFVKLVHASSERGMTDSQMGDLEKFGGALTLRDTCQLVVDRVIDPEQIPGLMNAGLLGRSSSKITDTVKAWKALGSPGSLREFVQAGGTQEAWQAHVAQKDQERQQKEQESEERRRHNDQRQADLAARNAPKHRKRGQLNHREDEPTVVDFGALCSEIDVHASLPDLEQDLTRVILVHGLLREGDRLVSMARLPARKESKLWSQCRPHLGENPSRKAFKRGLQVLVSRRLVAFSGGKHSLASPSARYPEAQQLLTQLRGLVAKYTT